MQIQIRLQELLEHYDLDDHGVIQRIADYLKLHRHTIRKLYNNQHSNPSLEVLGKVCDWLVHNDVPVETLPQALFGTGASGLARQGGGSRGGYDLHWRISPVCR